jgi:hypothetical protein
LRRLTVVDEVAWEGREIPGDRTAALLRALIDAGLGEISEDELVFEVWADGAPAHPREALQVVVSRARSATSAEVIERTRRGYKLSLEPTEVDAWAHWAKRSVAGRRRPPCRCAAAAAAGAGGGRR